MLEAIQQIGLTIIAYIAAGFAVAIIVGIGFWIFDKGPQWLQISLIVAIVGLFVSGIVYGFIDSDTHGVYYDEWEDRPYTGPDRYR